MFQQYKPPPSEHSWNTRLGLKTASDNERCYFEDIGYIRIEYEGDSVALTLTTTSGTKTRDRRGLERGRRVSQASAADQNLPVKEEDVILTKQK